MFETLVVIAIILAIVIAIVLLLASTKPDTFSVERSVVVKAPAEKIFPLVGDFHQWAKLVALGEQGSRHEALV